MEFTSYVPQGGIFFSDGDKWRAQHRITLSIFDNFGMWKMEQKIQNSIADMLEYLEGLQDKTKVNMFVPLEVNSQTKI